MGTFAVLAGLGKATGGVPLQNDALLAIDSAGVLTVMQRLMAILAGLSSVSPRHSSGSLCACLPCTIRPCDMDWTTVLPDYTVRVSQRLRDVSIDRFTRDALTAYDGRSIALPERFKPHPDFLTAHAARFEFL